MPVKMTTIDMSKFDIVHDETEASIKIVPVGAPPILLRRKKQKDIVYKIEDGLEWKHHMTFDVVCDQDTYNDMIRWWFANMSDQYKKDLIGTFESAIASGFDIKASANKAAQWLMTCPKGKRKGRLDRFLYNWIDKGARLVTRRPK